MESNTMNVNEVEDLKKLDGLILFLANEANPPIDTVLEYVNGVEEFADKYDKDYVYSVLRHR